MADQLPDVLQSAGITPHEVGWLHLHAEPVVRGADGQAVAELWLQAAFHPPGTGRVELVDAATGTTLVEVPLPAVSAGAAVRWRIPFQLAAGITVVRYHVEAGVPDEAVRIRSPWKLLDTIELRMPEEPTGNLELTSTAPAASNPSQQRPSGMKIHPARAHVREMVSFVLPAGPEEQFAPSIETLWMRGDPLDGDALRKRLRATPPSGPTCPNCYAALVPGGEFCPRCLGPVPGAVPPPLDVPVSMLPPLAAMAPHLKSSEEEVAHCALHPDHRSTGICNSCGKQFCDDCASTVSPSRCAACEASPSSHLLIKPQLAYRYAVLVQELAAAVLLIQPLVAAPFGYRVEWPYWSAIIFAALGFIVRVARRPSALLAAMAVNLSLLIEGIQLGHWVLIPLSLLAFALTLTLWGNLRSPDAPPDASDQELLRAKAAILAPQVYRDAALVHLAAFFLMVLRPFVGVAMEYRHVFTVLDALPAAGMGVLLFGLRKPFMLLAALGVDLLVLIDAYAVDDWSRLFVTIAVALVTGMLWLRLPDPNALPQS
ncbi:MAG TPA: hypothetical protein VIG99_03100 [Myxococcaceae bacterium]|jgi:hypothetical protein